MASLACMVMEKLIDHENFKSVDHENEVKVRWQMPSWYVPSIINVWTKYGEPRLYGHEETDLIPKTWSKNSKVSRQ